MNNADEILRTLLAQGTIEQADIDEVERSYLSEEMKDCVCIIHDLFNTEPDDFEDEEKMSHTWSHLCHQQWIMRTKEILDNAGIDTKVDDIRKEVHDFRQAAHMVEDFDRKTAALLQAYLNTHNNAATCDQKMNESDTGFITIEDLQDDDELPF